MESVIVTNLSHVDEMLRKELKAKGMSHALSPQEAASNIQNFAKETVELNAACEEAACTGDAVMHMSDADKSAEQERMVDKLIAISSEYGDMNRELLMVRARGMLEMMHSGDFSVMMRKLVVP